MWDWVVCGCVGGIGDFGFQTRSYNVILQLSTRFGANISQSQKPSNSAHPPLTTHPNA